MQIYKLSSSMHLKRGTYTKRPVSCTTSCYLYTPTTFTSYYKHYANLSNNLHIKNKRNPSN